MENDKVSKESKDLLIENVEQIKKIFPEVVQEGKINLEKLKSILGQELDNKEDSYTFNWAGRKDAFRSIQTTAKGTLVPNEKESINFKQTENIFIEGDNLEVLKLLQKSYFNQIKMIYIDPPYNTGRDFIYKDNFKNGLKAYLEQTGQLNGDGTLLTTNPETNGRFHSDWISMMYPRLFLARNLLEDDGIIFISIDDNEAYNLKRMMDEIFGEENFVAQIVVKSNPGGRDYGGIALTHEYIIVYKKDSGSELNQISKDKELELEDEEGKFEIRELRNRNIRFNNKNRPNLYYPFYVNIKSKDRNNLYEVSLNPTNGYSEVYPLESQGTKTVWRWGKKKVLENLNKNVKAKQKKDGTFQIIEKYRSNLKRARSIFDETDFRNERGTLRIKELFNNKPFDYPKSDILIKRLVNLGSEEDSIILDFFAGSGTTADAILQKNSDEGGNRRFILVQLPEKVSEDSEAYKQGYKTIAEIAKERIRRVIKKLEKEEKAKLTKENIDLGFKVFKLEKSNYKIWENYEGQDIKELTKQLDLFKSPLVNGYDDYNVIYECIVKEGLNLNAEIEKIDISGNTIYKVSDGNQSFHICLDEKIKQENLNKLDLKKDDLFICLDSSLDDSKKVNIALQCKLKTL